MSRPQGPQGPIQAKQEGTALFLQGPVTSQTVPELFAYYRKKGVSPEIERIDLSQVSVMDTSGAAFAEWLAGRPGTASSSSGSGSSSDSSISRDSSGASPEIQKLLEEFTARPAPPSNPASSQPAESSSSQPSASQPAPAENQAKHTRPHPLHSSLASLANSIAALGESLIKSFQGLGHFLILLAEVAFWSAAGTFRQGQRRKNSVLEQCWIIGVQSLPLVALLSIILGLILSLQSALQLRTFGANVFVADLMAVSMVTEMGPMMTAILIAGRSGSSIASEVATMQVSEEIDALRVMGIDPIRYVIVPKFLAMTVTIPLLVIFSIYLGIGGGVVVGMTVLDVTPNIFLGRVTAIIDVLTVLRSLAKSILFGWMIVVIGSHFGFSVSGGSEEVGLATTKAVVYSIISVILVDALFSMTYV